MIAVLLICAATLAPVDCQMENAIRVVRGPDVANEMDCAKQGQLFFAASPYLAEKLKADGRYLKVQCVETSIGKGNVG